ncbi:MAG TPA: hypothetical protein VJR58_12805 [Vineibacter sp.]|nr:hypothetical protein [Vineibacter sp.]
MTKIINVYRKLFGGCFAASLMLGAAACSHPEPPPPPPPVAVAPKPVPRPVPPKPVPTAQAAATEVSFSVSEGPTSPNKATNGTVRTPESQEATAPMPQQAPSLAGLSEDDVTRRFGRPANIRKTPSANVWTYQDQACTLDLFLFTDMRTGAQKVLTYQFGGSGRETMGERGCLDRLGHNGKTG